MHFRIRGNNVQLIKPVIDDSTGKSKPTLVGSVSLLTGKLNEKAQAALSTEEQMAVAKWLERHHALEHKKAEVTALGLADAMRIAAKHLHEMEPGLAKQLVAEVLQASHNFRLTARKHHLLEPASHNKLK